ncbi:hypothetical protein [Nocardia camponoti]|uniref:DUF732 domain-containing protein n=1 Tax=Nocardia camponoti TaxID=1616106 RepID=A0A917QE17_9NOCA|nr:hypothetical protein [Nocardia camponoti]GGK46026.1 hypothetical protein GCM10011591_16820 [Nocardia camponoti]
MSARSIIVTVSGAVLISVGAGLTAAPTALAAPVPPVAPSAPAAPGDYPLNSQGTQRNTPQQQPGAGNRQSEKVEKLGGGVATEVIDLVTGIIKCGLNLATDSVPCSL